jgi:hypothetical protein
MLMVRALSARYYWLSQLDMTWARDLKEAHCYCAAVRPPVG